MRLKKLRRNFARAVARDTNALVITAEKLFLLMENGNHPRSTLTFLQMQITQKGG